MSREHEPSTGLQVHLTRWEGQVLALGCAWPAGQTRVDLGSLLQALDLSEEARQEVQHCRLHRPEAGAERIGFEHACSVLRCSLNGQVLPAQQLVWLQEGDVLDVGLMRLELRTTPLARTASAAAEAPDEALDLRSLANEPRHAFDRLAPQRAPDAIDDLLRHTPTEVLDCLAATIPVEASSAQSEGQEAAKGSSAGGADVALQALPSDAGEDPLNVWHARYLQRLQSPMTPLAETDWHQTQSRQRLSGHDPMAELMAQADDGLPLAGLLGQSEHISTVLAQLDDRDSSQLLSDPENTNVMHLFAPAGWQEPDAAQVPLLTRQEHHGLALDSALALTETPISPNSKTPS